jgi:hypothetical protein
MSIMEAWAVKSSRRRSDCGSSSGTRSPQPTDATPTSWARTCLTCSAAASAPSTAVGGSGRFRAVTCADLDKVIGPLGNRTTTWRLGHEALITLNGRKVRWDVDENNHAVDRAHSHPMAVAFFAALDGITWTRGTGGDFVGTRRHQTAPDGTRRHQTAPDGKRTMNAAPSPPCRPKADHRENTNGDRQSSAGGDAAADIVLQHCGRDQPCGRPERRTSPAARVLDQVQGHADITRHCNSQRSFWERLRAERWLGPARLCVPVHRLPAGADGDQTNATGI